jgi:chemotaxis protein CheD
VSAPTKWVIPPPKKKFVVGVADMVASNDAGAEIVTYSLGSCLGVAIYDPQRKVGGLLHLMLPTSTIDPDKASGQPYMFVDTGVPRLFQAVYGLGGDRARLLLKVAGGAQFLDDERIFNIGQRNIAALTALCARNGFSINAQDLGGRSSRTVRLDLSTGQFFIHTPGSDPYLI